MSTVVTTRAPRSRARAPPASPTALTALRPRASVPCDSPGPAAWVSSGASPTPSACRAAPTWPCMRITRTQRSASSSSEKANGTAVSASASTMAASWEMRGESVICADHRTPRAPAEPTPLAHGPMSRRLLLRSERDPVHRDPAVLRVERHRRAADPAARLHVDAVQHARAVAGLVGQAGEDLQLSGAVARGQLVDQRCAVAGRPDALGLALQVHGAERVLVERDLVDVVVVRVPPQVAVEPDVLREHRLVGVVDDPVGLGR